MKNLFMISFFLISLSVFSQQTDIERINQMPDFPQPYEMRNWKQIAQKYDSLVYNESLSGDNLPLFENFETTINYPSLPSFGLHTYVGTKSPLSGEGINVIPSVIGASLCGIDKSQQFGKNYVLMCQEFFNKASGEDVYLNNPGGRSGHDWWYESMPNVFFYQLNDLYPHTGDFDNQFIQIADRWLEAVKAMGGNDTPWALPEMNYRAWNLQKMEALNEGVKEPEAAGALAWILYNAYQETGNIKYRTGAEWCLEFLGNLESNPSYELQLSYGVYTAAKMNAQLGTQYDIDKMINWCFNIGPLRNWGALVGNFGGIDCSGLIGEQSAGGTAYGFTMNGFQQAAALLPLLRYNDRYAKALGKWILNLANASRLFYSNYLPSENQDENTWSVQHDPESLIAYEALKESLNDKSPFATGDAVRGGWATTNLALYGSSHVGMLGSILKETNIEGVLRIDLLKTDFYRKEAFPTFLYYNPHATSQEIELDFGENIYDIYESCSNEFEDFSLTGKYMLNISAGEAKIIVLVPAGAELTYEYDHSLANDVVIDYQNGKTISNYPPRIKSLASKDSIILINSTTTIYCTAIDNEDNELQYNWTGEENQWTNTNTLQWQAPDQTGYYSQKCIVKDAEGLLDSMQIVFHVVDHIIASPIIDEFYADNRKLHPGTSTNIHCNARDPNNDPLQYIWSINGKNTEDSGNEILWTAPSEEETYNIKCTVINNDLLTTSDSVSIMVRDSSYSQSGKLVAGFALNTNANDFSNYQNHGNPININWVSDPDGKAEMAAEFNGSSSSIRIPNQEYLNFKEGISIIFYIKPAENVSGEQFIISHGSWQNRWKLSINSELLRFTLNATTGITDLDSESKLETGVWQHLAAVYNGKDMEIYIDGKLNSFKAFSGSINPTNYDITMGQMLPEDFNYNFKGCIDDLRIFNYGIKQETIDKIFSGELNPVKEDRVVPAFSVYPNPSKENVIIRLNKTILSIEKIWIYGSAGNTLWISENPQFLAENGQISLNIEMLKTGIYFICVLEQGNLYTQKLVIV